jgi:hypothetical protein
LARRKQHRQKEVKQQAAVSSVPKVPNSQLDIPPPPGRKSLLGIAREQFIATIVSTLLLGNLSGGLIGPYFGVIVEPYIKTFKRRYIGPKITYATPNAINQVSLGNSASQGMKSKFEYEIHPR